MKLVGASATQRIFVERGTQCKDCIPRGTNVDDFENARLIAFVVIVLLIGGTLAQSGIQEIVQGSITNGGIIVTLISIFACLACIGGIVSHTWREQRKRNRSVIRYIFDLHENKLSIEDTYSKSRLRTISSSEFNAYSVEFIPPCYRVMLMLSGINPYIICSRIEPPTSEFTESLRMIGIRPVTDKKDTGAEAAK